LQFGSGDFRKSRIADYSEISRARVPRQLYAKRFVHCRLLPKTVKNSSAIALNRAASRLVTARVIMV
jgi:hypothetical protein